MKLILQTFICIAIFCTQNTLASTKTKELDLQVKKLDIADNMFQCENMYFGGQPNLETIEWLKAEGVNLVINLRSEEENSKFAKSAFNEEKKWTEMGINYVSLPVSGYDSYTPENLAKLEKALSTNHKKVFIHCASCGRVTYFMMAYLVKYKDYSMDKAIAFGKQLKFKFPLEYLLDEELVFESGK